MSDIVLNVRSLERRQCPQLARTRLKGGLLDRQGTGGKWTVALPASRDQTRHKRTLVQLQKRDVQHLLWQSVRAARAARTGGSNAIKTSAT